MPAASVARTRKVWDPSERLAYAFGEEQVAKAPESRLHWKVEPGSLEEKPKLGEGLVVVPVGPEVIVVSGGVVSTVNVRVAGKASTLPVLSTARTLKV